MNAVTRQAHEVVFAFDCGTPEVLVDAIENLRLVLETGNTEETKTMTREEIEKRFADRKSPDDTSEERTRRSLLVSEFRDFAGTVVCCAEDGRELSLTMTKLEEAFAWAMRAEPRE